LSAVTDERVEAWVKRGDRPPLNSVKGNADLVSFAKRWIPQCWHKSREKRPTFDGKHSDAEMFSTTIFICIEVAYYCYKTLKQRQLHLKIHVKKSVLNNT